VARRVEVFGDWLVIVLLLAGFPVDLRKLEKGVTKKVA